MLELGERARLVHHPGGTARLGKALGDDVEHADEVAHVVNRVVYLLGREGTGAPIGERLALGERHAAERVHERVIGALLPLTQKRGRHLGVEDRRGQRAQHVVEHLHIL